MDLSPNDIRNYEFPNQMRGYNKDEVDNFKEQVANAIEGLKHENLKLSMEIDSLKSQLAGLKQFEDTIKNAAIDARRNADMTVANAKKEAELMLSKAKAEAEQAIAARAKQISDIENQLQKIELTKKSYINKVHGLLHSHLELIEDIAAAENMKDISEESLDITDSAEVESKKRETFATQPSEDKAIKTEDAKAADNIVEVEPPRQESDEAPQDEMTESLRDAVKDEAPEEPPEQPEEPKNIDPELAAALESYQKKVEGEAQAENLTPPQKDVAPPDNVTITDARAEDVPNGFIAKQPKTEDNDSTTDKVSLAPDVQDTPTEHNTIDIDKPEAEKPKEQHSEPGNLANELDEVVAKFEEEMDKAEKS